MNLLAFYFVSTILPPFIIPSYQANHVQVKHQVAAKIITVNSSTQTPFIGELSSEEISLLNVSWEKNMFSGQVKNNSKEKIFNVKIKLLVSSGKNIWSPSEISIINIPYIIPENKGYSFSKDIKNSKSSWWTAQIVSVDYINGKKTQYSLVSPTPTPTNSPTPTLTPEPPKTMQESQSSNSSPIENQQTDTAVENNQSGKNGANTKGAASDVLNALNSYRKTHGVGELSWDNGLAQMAQQRAELFASTGHLDNHKGFNDFFNNIDNMKQMGFLKVGENSSFGWDVSPVELIEKVYASDAPHNNNQLDSSWTHVGIGLKGSSSDLIFGGNKL